MQYNKYTDKFKIFSFEGRNIRRISRIKRIEMMIVKPLILLAKPASNHRYLYRLTKIIHHFFSAESAFSILGAFISCRSLSINPIVFYPKLFITRIDVDNIMNLVISIILLLFTRT